MNFQTFSVVAGEELRIAQHPSGMVVLHHPRRHGVRTFATVCAGFGSADEDESQGLPMGTAHFLEHLLFQHEDGDVALRFSERGAYCNAATEHHRTSYQFSTVEDPLQNLSILLDLVLRPQFSAPGVERERAIIGQEIRMVEDDPDWRGFSLLLEALYHHHPVRNPIAGTVESIAGIDSELLGRCHARHYGPANLVLSVSGPLPEADLAGVLEQALGQHPGGTAAPVRRLPIEPDSVCAFRRELQLGLSHPQLWLGFKDPDGGTAGRPGLRHELGLRMLLELLFSASSATHEDLERRRLIDDGFDAFYTCEAGAGFTILASDTDEPELLEEALFEALDRARRTGLSAEDFELLRRRHLGRTVRGFDSPEAVASLMADCHSRGVSPHDLTMTMAELSLDDLHGHLHRDLVPQRSARAVLRPRSSVA